MRARLTAHVHHHLAQILAAHQPLKRDEDIVQTLGLVEVADQLAFVVPGLERRIIIGTLGKKIGKENTFFFL